MSQTPPRPPTPSSPARLRPRVKVWFEAEGRGFGFGSGLVAILEAVEECGSIKQAAAGLGQSYRHVWARIKRAEQAIGQPLVVTQVGGKNLRRSALTEPARHLIRDFLALRARLIDAIERVPPP